MRGGDAPELYPGTPEGFYEGYLSHLRGRRRILDYGCGRGGFLRWATERGLEAVGYEPCAEARARAVAEGLTILERRPDLSDFDALVMICVIEHLDREELDDVLAAHRGLLVVQCDEPRWREPWYLFRRRADFWDDPEHRRPYTPTALLRLVLAHGYAVLERGRARATRPRLHQLRSQLVRFRLWRYDKLYGIQSPHYLIARRD